MADSLQSMIANRMQGEARARLQRFYIDRGYPPETAAALAAVEMANRDREARINSPEAGFTGQQGDILERAARLSAQEPGYYGQSGRTLQYSVNPRLLAEGEPAPQMDEFRETAPSPQDMAAMRLRERAQAQSDRDREVAMPWYEMPAYRDEASAVRARQEEQANFERNLRENSARVGQAADEQRRRDLEVARQALDPRRLDVVTTPRDNAPATGGVPPMPSSATSMPSAGGSGSGGVDRVDSATRSEIDNQLPSYPFFSYSRPDQINRLGGAAQSILGGPLAIGGQGMQPSNVPDWNKAPEGQFAPYLMQNRPNFMRFSTDQEAPMANRPSPRAQNAGPAATTTQQAAAQTEQPWYSRIFSGPQYQSARGQVVQREEGKPTRLNWGDSDSAADFFRADRARQELEKNKEEFTGMNRGGSAGGGHGKDATIMKALEIIHHMLRTR